MSLRVKVVAKWSVSIKLCPYCHPELAGVHINNTDSGGESIGVVRDREGEPGRGFGMTQQMRKEVPSLGYMEKLGKEALGRVGDDYVAFALLRILFLSDFPKVLFLENNTQ